MEISIRNFKLSVTWSTGKPAEIPPDKLLFDRLHLDGLLRPTYDNKTNLIGILLSQLSVLVSISLTLLVSEISSKWGIDKELWKFAIVGIFTLVGAWSVFVAVRIARQPSFETFLSGIVARSLTILDRRFVFLITSRDTTKLTRVLVQYSDSWSCWLLPNFSKSQSEEMNSSDKLLSALASKIGADPSDLSLTALNDDLLSSKISYKNKSFTNYYFDFYHVSINSERIEEKLQQQEVEIGGVRFRWMTTGELKAHQNTKERNSDVIDHIEDRIFANGTPSFSMQQEVEVK